MRRRMVLADRATPLVIDLKRQRFAGFQRTFLDCANMHEDVAGVLLGVGHLEAHTLARHRSDIADLAAGFAVEWCLVENDGAALALLERGDFFAVAYERCDH